MDFNEVMTKVTECLTKIGSSIGNHEYDGIIVKRLEASNTLDKGRTTNQSHIAITGDQMDMFPYVRLDGYFKDDYGQLDGDLKKYFVAQVPAVLHKENIDYLDSEANIFTDNERTVYVSIVRSRRNGAADQLQISMTNMDSPEYVAYRRIVHAGSYLIMLKRKAEMKYDIYSVKPSDSESLSSINNVFVKLPTNTPVHVDELLDAGTDDLVEDVLNHNLYGIHIKEENDALSDERQHICIGWSKLGDITGISSRSELEIKYKKTWPDDKARTVGQNVGQIWRFVSDAKSGDYVIYADGDQCHIGKISSDYYYENETREGQSPDYVNVRDVIWLKKNIKRSELSESLHRSLMTAMSFWTMNDYRAAIADLLNGTYVKDEPVADGEGIISAEEQQARFRKWMNKQKKSNGEPYSQNTINNYINNLNQGYSKFEPYHDYKSVFEIQNEAELIEYKNYLFNAPGFDDFNESSGKKSCSNGLMKYIEFVAATCNDEVVIRFKTSLPISESRNRIIFGAPGTGKSYMINEQRKELLGADNESDYERVTFHPDYTYANFVGTYKPVPCKDDEGKDAITYEYVPGPFMRVYVNALKNAMTGNPKPYLLIIEEINRANVAAVFGDVFQLLDRDDDEISEYPIQASEDIKKYLAKELKCSLDKVEKIKIPDNMFIWATMNSADQGVFPMDTAFKRRWDFTYIGIDDNDVKISGKYVVIGSKYSQKVEWNALRKAINNYLSKLKINEDKQLGPFFISRKIVLPEKGNEIDSKKFCETFKSKVIMYLFEDAARQKRPTLFEGCFNHSSRYSDICKEFDEHGLGIFNNEIILACDAKTEDLTTNDHDSSSVWQAEDNDENGDENK